mmetsp:Transcript_5312/g.13844  ORF Transcript_5312/g.13844 Transcript_5312/m.13844 type:complete len:273 (-) Transcript_5312:43-861(-)
MPRRLILPTARHPSRRSLRDCLRLATHRCEQAPVCNERLHKRADEVGRGQALCRVLEALLGLAHADHLQHPVCRLNRGRLLEARKQATCRIIEKRSVQIACLFVRAATPVERLDVLGVDRERRVTVGRAGGVVLEHAQAGRAVAVVHRHALVLRVGRDGEGARVIPEGQIVLPPGEALVATLLGARRLLPGLSLCQRHARRLGAILFLFGDRGDGDRRAVDLGDPPRPGRRRRRLVHAVLGGGAARLRTPLEEQIEPDASGGDARDRERHTP